MCAFLSVMLLFFFFFCSHNFHRKLFMEFLTCCVLAQSPNCDFFLSIFLLFSIFFPRNSSTSAKWRLKCRNRTENNNKKYINKSENRKYARIFWIRYSVRLIVCWLRMVRKIFNGKTFTISSKQWWWCYTNTRKHINRV